MKKYCFLLLSLFANGTNYVYDQSHIIKYTNNVNFTYFSYLNDSCIKDRVLSSLEFNEVKLNTVAQIFKFKFGIGFGNYLDDIKYDTIQLREFSHILSNFRVFSFPYFSLIHNANNLLRLFNFDYYTTGSITLYILQLPVIYFQCIMNVSSHELGHFVGCINSGHYTGDNLPKIDMGSIFNLNANSTWGSDPYLFVNSILINSSGVIAGLELSKYFFFEKMQDLNYLGVASNIGIGVYPLYGLINYFYLDLSQVEKAVCNQNFEESINTAKNQSHSGIRGSNYLAHSLNLNGDIANIFFCLAKYRSDTNNIYVLGHGESEIDKYFADSSRNDSLHLAKNLKTNLTFYYNRYKYSYLLNLANTRALYCISNFFYNSVYQKNIIPEKSIFLFRYMPALYFNIEPFGAIYRLSFLKFFLNRRSMINFDLDYVDSFFKPQNNDTNDTYNSIISQACNIKVNWINIFNSYKYSLFVLDGEFGCAFNQPLLARSNNKTIVEYDDNKINYHTMLFGRLIVKLNIKIYSTIISFKIFFEAKNHGYYTGLNLRSGWSLYPVMSFSYIKL